MYIKKQTKQRKAERKYLSFYKPKTTVNILRNMQFRAQFDYSYKPDFYHKSHNSE